MAQAGLPHVTVGGAEMLSRTCVGRWQEVPGGSHLQRAALGLSIPAPALADTGCLIWGACGAGARVSDRCAAAGRAVTRRAAQGVCPRLRGWRGRAAQQHERRRRADE